MIKRTDSRILENMVVHYSQPKGFVGRNICYAVEYNGEYFGSIVGGSATLHLPGREDFIKRNNINCTLEEIVNNIFFHIEGPYPVRNFAQKVLQLFHEKIMVDWKERYGDDVKLFETLVELPRTGEVYTRFGYELVGQTKGFTCKRVAGNAGEKWGGMRVWNKDKETLRPKLVFMLDTKSLCIQNNFVC